MSSPVTLAYQNRLRAVRLSTRDRLGEMWDGLDELHRSDAETFAERAVPVVRAGQVLAAKLTNGYVAKRAGIQPVALDLERVTGAGARNGLDPLEEYQRPFGSVWGALGRGRPLEEARAAGRAHLDVLAVADVWLAMRATTAVIDELTPRITGWHRVADPGACDLCAAADGAPTSAAADLAGHPGCGCTNEPTMGDPPAQPTIAERDGVSEEVHDELGPVLTVPGQHFARA